MPLEGRVRRQRFLGQGVSGSIRGVSLRWSRVGQPRPTPGSRGGGGGGGGGGDGLGGGGRRSGGGEGRFVAIFNPLE